MSSIDNSARSGLMPDRLRERMRELDGNSAPHGVADRVRESMTIQARAGLVMTDRERELGLLFASSTTQPRAGPVPRIA
ncbi:MAG: hypothetical protein QM831_12220 [Kofleriaceae bacterium]